MSLHWIVGPWPLDLTSTVPNFPCCWSRLDPKVQGHILVKKQERIPVGCVPSGCLPYVWWPPLGVSSRVATSLHTQPLPLRRDLGPEIPMPRKDMRPGLPPPREETDACENITFPKTYLRAVMKYSKMTNQWFFIIKTHLKLTVAGPDGPSTF